MPPLQDLTAAFATWKAVLCAFFASVVDYCRKKISSAFRRTSGYDGLVNLEPSPPASPLKAESDRGRTEDLESGLSDSPLSLSKRVRPPSESPSAPASTRPVPVLTSSFLSAFLLEGRGITLSPSAKVMLSTGIWSPNASLSSNFVKGPRSSQICNEGEETKMCSSSPVELSPGPAMHPNLGALAMSRVTDNGFPDVPQTPSRPRPPSGVRHSLRFSMLPQPISRPRPESVLNPLPSSDRSVGSFISLPGSPVAFHGGLIVEGDDVHLPTSLSSPELRYHEFYYQYYCQEPVLPLDGPTEEAIRLSLLGFSPVLVIPPVAELSELSIHFPREEDEERPLSSTPRIPPSQTPSTSGIPKVEPAKSTPFFLLPAFRSLPAAIGSSGKPWTEEGSPGKGNNSLPVDGETTIAVSSSSSSSSFYVDSDTGNTTRELGNDSDRTLRSVKQAGYGKTLDLGVSEPAPSERSSTSGSENSDASGEATLFHAKRGSLARPVIIMRVPGTRQSFILHADSQTERLNFPAAEDEVPEATGASRVEVMTGTNLEAPGAGDEEDGSASSEDESSVKWLSWPNDANQAAWTGIEDPGSQTPSSYVVPDIRLSPPSETTSFDADQRQWPDVPNYNPRRHFDTRSSPTLQANLRQMIVSHIQDFIPAKLPEYFHGSSSMASLSASPQPSPTSASFLRPPTVAQVGSANEPLVGLGGTVPPQVPFTELAHAKAEGRFAWSVSPDTDAVRPPSLSDSRYPTFIPANCPPSESKRRGRARAKSVPTRLRNEMDHHDGEYESASRLTRRELDLESSDSNQTVNAVEILGAFHAVDSRLNIGGDGKPKRRFRQGRRKTDAADRGIGVSRTFIAPGEDSGQDDVPSDYSGACAL